MTGFRIHRAGLAALAIALAALVARAADGPPKDSDDKPDADAPAKAPAKEEFSVTQHSVVVGGQTIRYTSTAGTLLLKDDKDEPTASVFYTAYTLPDAGPGRPVTFAYNGGPGSSSVWLHMGSFGPKRVVTEDAKASPPAPYRLVDNGYCLLDRTDIVFIDPVGTGFSKAVGKAKEKDFWGVQQDIRSMGQFIVTYVNRNHRWNSPKYLLGESYGTFRSAGLVNYLQSKKGMDFNGVVLISSCLDMSSLEFAPGDDRSFVFYLPSYAATAWYHNALKDRPADLKTFLVDARRFAAGDYAAALAQGSEIPAADKTAMARRLSGYTGLSPDYIEKANLRVNLFQFMQELQRGQGEVTSRFDTRFTGYTLDLLAEYATYDPQEAAITGAFTAAFNGYIRDELKFGGDKEYVTESDDAINAWDWRRTEPDDQGLDSFVVNVEPELTEALNENPHLQVQVENGLYDLATPFYATEFTMTHLGLPPMLKGHIELKYYESGHMMYLHEASLAELKKNISAFIERTSSREE
jgi:carboxypeptidase C (cathepsin A)